LSNLQLSRRNAITGGGAALMSTPFLYAGSHPAAHAVELTSVSMPEAGRLSDIFPSSPQVL
jgi:hypothetical protein